MKVLLPVAGLCPPWNIATFEKLCSYHTTPLCLTRLALPVATHCYHRDMLDAALGGAVSEKQQKRLAAARHKTVVSEAYPESEFHAAAAASGAALGLPRCWCNQVWL